MFGMSWPQIMLIMVIGVFLLGPERIPVAVQWVFASLKKVRTMAQGAQEQLNSELGPEIAELRRQIADLQGLNELQELRQLRDLHPKNLIGKGLLGGEGQPTGGVAGFLGLDSNLLNPVKPVSAGGPAEAVAAAAAASAAQPEVSMVKPDTAPPAAATADPLPLAADPLPPVAADPVPRVAADPVPPLAADPLPGAAPVADPVAAPVPGHGPVSQAAPEPVPEPVSEPAAAHPPFDIDGT